LHTGSEREGFEIRHIYMIIISSLNKMTCPSLLLGLLSIFVATRIGGNHAFTPAFSSRRLAAPLRLWKDTTRDGSGSEPNTCNKNNSLSRRLFTSRLVGTAAAVSTGAFLFLQPGTALAGIDMSSLKTLPIEGDASGAAARLKQLQMQGATVERTAPRVLDGGVSYREISAGRDSARSIRRGSNVGAEITIRTPGGLQCFSTRDDNDSNEFAWTVGSGDFLKGVEDGMMGMKLNAVRRIEVPSQQIFAARIAGLLPEATTDVGKTRYETIFQSGDATLVFEVRVTGINQGDNRI
jgi:hypothetical protein